MKEVKFEELNEKQKKLLEDAEKAMNTAYQPYSNFYVGAAILTQSGKIITGSNCENASYGLTNCAERSAIFRANALGERMYDSIAVIAKGKDFDTTDVTAPCGACRQVIYEFSQVSNKDIELIMSTTKKDKIIIATINELLPLTFGPKDLGVSLEKYRK